jgi:peptidoglycan/LPS O-acetylase OafA/YrhL
MSSPVSRRGPSGHGRGFGARSAPPGDRAARRARGGRDRLWPSLAPYRYRLAIAVAEAPSPALAPPPGNPRFPLFDALRGCAVLAVLNFHVALYAGAVNGGTLGDTFSVVGYLGPPIFFAISGFLLYRPFVANRVAGRHSPSLRRYGRRRVLRIVPAYWFVLTVLAIFPGIVGVFTGEWWRYYGFLQLYTQRTLGEGIPVAWTLCVEVTFYLLLPVWAFAVGRASGGRRRREIAILAVAGCAGLAVQVAAGRQAVPWLTGETLAGQFSWFAVGMAMAVLSAHGARDWVPRWLPRPAVLWGVAVLAAAGLVANTPAGGAAALFAEPTAVRPWHMLLVKVVLTMIFVIFVLLPVAFDRSVGVAHRVLSTRPLVFVGVISYSAYLWHLIIVAFLARGSDSHFSSTGLNVLGHVHFARMPILLVLTAGVTAVVASLSYRFVELPFLRRKERPRGSQLLGDARRLATEQPDPQ